MGYESGILSVKMLLGVIGLNEVIQGEDMVIGEKKFEGRVGDHQY